MSTDDIKAQARRLQAFLKSNPDHATALGGAKHSSCLEAVAAIHGARNWNTLQAGSALPPYAKPAPVNSVPAAFALPVYIVDGKPLGKVEYMLGRSGVGKSFATVCDLAQAVSTGRSATVLDIGGSYRHLAQALGGVATTVETADSAVKLPSARIAAFEFEGWQRTLKVLGFERYPIADLWSRGVLPHLRPRLLPGNVLVVDEFFMFTSVFKQYLPMLLSFLQEAKSVGMYIRIIGQDRGDFATLETFLPPDVVTEKAYGAR